jgi:hypothetical protein
MKKTLLIILATLITTFSNAQMYNNTGFPQTFSWSFVSVSEQICSTVIIPDGQSLAYSCSTAYGRYVWIAGGHIETEPSLTYFNVNGYSTMLTLSNVWGWGPVSGHLYTDDNNAKVYIKSIGLPPANTNDFRLADPTLGGNVCSRGMAGYSFNALQGSLVVQDTPVGYSPPLGPDIAFTLVYNQRDSSQPTNPPFSNLGPKWSFSPVSFIVDDPNSNTNVLCVLKGGGAEPYSGYTNGIYATQPSSHTILTKYGGGYFRTFPDGSQATYSTSDTATNWPRRIYLSVEQDPAGNVITCNRYDAPTNGTVRLVSVTDAIGQTTTLSYGYSGDVLKVTRITDPFGRSAVLQYAQTNGAVRLISTHKHHRSGADRLAVQLWTW